MRKLVVGCGYLGQRVAARWHAAGTEVHVVTRSAERAITLAHAGFVPVVADVLKPAAWPSLPRFDTVLFAVGFDRSAGVPMHQVYVTGLGNVLQILTPTPPTRFVYISSTGVYGGDDDQWVDEDTPCQPRRAGGIACLEAERRLQSSPLAARSIILRLAGIYGPGRLPRKADLLAARPVPAARDGFINLIHVEDAVEVVLAAEARSPLPGLYIVSDGQPVSRTEYLAELARLLDAPPPIYTDPPEGSAQAERATSSKRASNRRMLRDLRVHLRFPSYREGLAAILASETKYE